LCVARREGRAPRGAPKRRRAHRRSSETKYRPPLREKGNHAGALRTAEACGINGAICFRHDAFSLPSPWPVFFSYGGACGDDTMEERRRPGGGANRSSPTFVIS
jgi:hypothetical protein